MKEKKTNHGSLLIIIIPIIIFAILSFILLFNGIKGWGWFLFLAFAFGSEISFQDNDDEKDK